MALFKKEFLLVVAGALVLTACEDTGQSVPIPKSSDNSSATTAKAEVKLPDLPLGNTNFEQFDVAGALNVENNAVLASDGFHKADTITFYEKHARIFQRLGDSAVTAGDTATASVEAWGNGNIQLQVLRSCSQSPAEHITLRIALTPTPQRYDITHTYENSHDCLQLQLRNMDETETTLNAYDLRLDVK